MFHDNLKRENVFLDHNNNKWRTRKIKIFPEGLVHGFDQNWQFFHHFILGKQRQQNVFRYILERENALLDHNNNKLKTLEKFGFFQQG